MDGKVTCTHLAALAPRIRLNREFLVLEHLQRPLRNHREGSVPEDRQAVDVFLLLKRGNNVDSEPTDRHTFSMEGIKMDYQVFGLYLEEEVGIIRPNMGWLRTTVLVK